MAELPDIDPIPIFTGQTVREKIIDRIFAYLKELEESGVVLDYASEEDDDLTSIRDALNDGKYAIEVLPGQSEPMGLTSSTTLNSHTWELPIMLLIHLPKHATLKPYQQAARISTTIFKVVHPSEFAMGTWDGLAIQTRWESGTDGAEVFVDPKTALKSTAMVFRVMYRHAFHDPAVQA